MVLFLLIMLFFLGTYSGAKVSDQFLVMAGYFFFSFLFSHGNSVNFEVNILNIIKSNFKP